MKLAYLPVILLLTVFARIDCAQAESERRGGGRFMRDRPAAEQRDMSPRRADGEGRGRREESAGGEPRRELSPDERRQLRRDIQEAGRDIYRPDRPPRHFRQRD